MSLDQARAFIEKMKSVVAFPSKAQSFFVLRVLKPLLAGCALSMLSCNALAIPDFHPKPTIPTLDQLWGLSMIGHDRAVEAGFTGKGVVVGVVDDIIYVNHPEFAQRVLATYNIYGAAYVPSSDDFHGTHVAGTILGKNVGVAPGSQLVGINMFDVKNKNPGFDDHIVAGYEFGLHHGVRVFNNSWGAGPIDIFTRETFEIYLPGLLQAFRNTAAAGAIQVFSAGNDGSTKPCIPAGIPYYFPELQPYWINVVAVGPDRTLAWYSNAADVAAEWTIAAPGGAGKAHNASDYGTDEVIWSAYLSDAYASLFGTSMAAPHVTGAVAVTAEIFPKSTGPELVQMVLQTATDIGAPGVDAVYGWGLLNLGNIVQSIEPRTAGLFANAAWSRFATMNHMGTALRQHLLSPVLGSGTVKPEERLSFSAGQGEGRVNITNPKSAGLWVLPIYGDATLASGTDSQSAHAITTGAWFGTDLIDYQTSRLGIAAGLSRSDMETSTSSDNGRTDAVHFGVFASRNWDNWILEGSGQLVLMAQSLSRYAISGADGTSRIPVGHSSFDTDGLEASVSLARKFEHAGSWSISPYAALNWRWQKSDAFNEADARIFSLKAPSNTLSQLEPGVGLRWSSAPAVSRIGCWWFSSDLGYSNLTGDLDHGIQVTLLGRPIQGVSATVGRDIFNVGAQLNFVTVSQKIAAFLAYRGRFQQNAKENTIMAGLDLRL